MKHHHLNGFLHAYFPNSAFRIGFECRIPDAGGRWSPSAGSSLSRARATFAGGVSSWFTPAGGTKLGRTWIGELDGLRGLAALSVVLAHYNPTSWGPYGWFLQWIPDVVRRLSLANLGVVFFYTLSAFLLTYLGVREYDRGGAFNVKRFYVRRCFRICPLYFTLLGINLVVAAPVTCPPKTLDPISWDAIKSIDAVLCDSAFQLAKNYGYED